MMKMNGMKISSYWFVYFIFNLLLGLMTNIIFFFFGYFLLENRFFTETDLSLLFFTMLGWLLAQIGLAVFFQTFLSSARSANIIGYLISIWTCMIGSTLSIGIYQFPAPYPVKEGTDGRSKLQQTDGRIDIQKCHQEINNACKACSHTAKKQSRHGTNDDQNNDLYDNSRVVCQYFKEKRESLVERCKIISTKKSCLQILYI